MTTRLEAFAQSAANCFLTVGDSGAPTFQVRPNRVADTSWYPALDAAAQVALEPDEQMAFAAPSSTVACWWGDAGQVWFEAAAYVLVTDRRIVHLGIDPTSVPSLRGIWGSMVRRDMDGTPMVFGQVRLDWCAWIRCSRLSTEPGALALTVGLADEEPSGRLAPVKLQYQVAVGPQAVIAAFHAIDAVCAGRSDSVKGDLDAASQGTGSRLHLRPKASLPDGRRYRMLFMDPFEASQAQVLGAAACLHCGAAASPEHWRCGACGSPLDTI